MPYIAVDTNIFEHLLNPGVNHDAHIDKLLGKLIQLQYLLLVDSTRKIGNEYQQLIVPIIKNMDETRPQLPLLRHWMLPEIREVVTLVSHDALMQHIKAVVHEPAEHADRAFIYVVCKQNSTLVTNDSIHILGRRDQLLKKTRRERGKDTDIQCSVDAHTTFMGTGDVQ